MLLSSRAAISSDSLDLFQKSLRGRAINRLAAGVREADLSLIVLDEITPQLMEVSPAGVKATATRDLPAISRSSALCLLPAASLCYNCAHVVHGSYRLRIDYLVIGHVTQDLTPGGMVPGGTAYYAAVTAQRLGCRVALVTRAPAALVEQVQAAAPGLEVCVLPGEQATTFENHYRGNDRQQVLHHAAAPLAAEDIPAAWRQPAIVHLAPVAREIDPGLAAHFCTSLVCATPQGWLREWDEAGRVRHVALRQPRKQLRAIDAMVFSAEDVNHDPHEMRVLIDSVPVVAVTRAAEGAVLYTRDGARPSPARAAQLVDPTGAGDVFAAAFFTSLRRSGDPYEATAFANVVASFSIERPGIEGIPTRAAVESWFARQASQRGIG